MDGPFEIISRVRRRRNWSPEEKVEILDAAFRPGGSVAAASDRYVVARSLIYLWRRQARAGGIPGVAVTEPSKPEFAAVQVGGNELVGSYHQSKWISSKCRRPEVIEIVLRNGRIIKVRDTIESAALTRIVAAVDGDGDT